MMKKIWNRKNKKGFTLVELMVVVAIIGILVAIAVPVYNNITANSRKTACQANQRTLASAIVLCQANTGAYPAQLADLVTGGYMAAVPVCTQAPAGGGAGPALGYVATTGAVTCTTTGHTIGSTTTP